MVLAFGLVGAEGAQASGKWFILWIGNRRVEKGKNGQKRGTNSHRENE